MTWCNELERKPDEQNRLERNQNSRSGGPVPWCACGQVPDPHWLSLNSSLKRRRISWSSRSCDQRVWSPSPPSPAAHPVSRQFLWDLLPGKLSEAFPGCFLPKGSKFWLEFTLHFFPLSPEMLVWIDESRTASLGCSGNRQLSLLELSSRLSIHVSLGPSICMIAHSETDTCTRASLAAHSLRWARPSCLQAACLNKACPELSPAAEEKLYVRGWACCSHKRGPTHEAYQGYSGGQLWRVCLPRELPPSRVGACAKPVLHSHLALELGPGDTQPPHQGDVPKAPDFLQVQDPHKEASPWRFHMIHS